jgi:pyruvate dehydrogenase E2 component (dihydrolipoamide acetyltransferase)
MPTSILMPSLSPTMEEGVIASWLVKEGDLIKPGTMLCSVETDKTTVDYESMDEGYLRKIVVPSGNAKVNQLIAILSDEKDEDISAFLAKEMEKSAKVTGGSAVTPAQAGDTAAPAPAASPESTPAASGASTSLATSSPAPAAPAPAAAPAASDDGRVKASPLARKVAAEAGVPLSSVTATGPGGRIITRDVEAAKSAPKAAPAAAATQTGVTPKAGADAPVQRPLFGSLAPVGDTQDIPLTKMRKIIGSRLLESAQTTPVFFVTMKVEIDALNKLRAELNRAAGYKISVNDIIVRATAFALRQYPVVNSSLHGDFIRQHSNIDICVAVAIPDGLITPIVRNADQKGLGAISKEVKALVGKAKSGKLAPEEFQGGTFTISNLGMFGVDEFTAIINPPQAAILAVGGSQSEVYLEDGVAKERGVMKLTLSSDHRVIDGAMAAQFLSGLKSLLENPVWLML